MMANNLIIKNFCKDEIMDISSYLQANVPYSTLNDLFVELKVAAERSRGLEQCCERAQDILLRLKKFQGDNASAEVQSVLWYETYTKSFMLHVTPIDVASIFQKHTDNFSASWLFTSATLQVNKQFNLPRAYLLFEHGQFNKIE